MTVTSLTVAFYEYPPSCGRAQLAIESVDRLVAHLDKECGVRPNLNLVDGSTSFTEYTSLLHRFLAECESRGRALDILWLHSLLLVARDPEPHQLYWAQGFLEMKKSTYEPVEPWLKGLLKKPLDERSPPTHQFISLPDGPQRREGQGGPWGAEWPPYDGRATAVERTGYENAVYHAFLHLLRVNDGYDQVYQTRAECDEKCWMQYNPNHGTGLCLTHLQELRGYIAEMLVSDAT